MIFIEHIKFNGLTNINKGTKWEHKKPEDLRIST